MKFWLDLAQVTECRLQLCASQLAVSGNEGRGIIPGGEQQFMVEGRRGHHARGVTAGHGALGRQVEGVEGMRRT
ncbi:hypothetical protein D3C71_1970390 [compost metagenome]